MKNKFLIIGLSATLLTIAGVVIAFLVYNYSSDEKNYERGIAAFIEKDYDTAASNFSRVSDPNSHGFEQANAIASVIYLEQDKKDKALKTVRRLLDMDHHYNENAMSVLGRVLLTGALSPEVPVDSVRAAHFLAKSRELGERLIAIDVFYKAGMYRDALNVRDNDKCPWLGLLYFYGIETKPDIEEAWKRLKDAPDMPEFASEKADLMLLNYNNDESVINTVSKALALYKMVPDNKKNDVAVRIQFIEQLIEAYNTHEHIGYDEFPTKLVYWCERLGWGGWSYRGLRYKSEPLKGTKLIGWINQKGWKQRGWMVQIGEFKKSEYFLRDDPGRRLHIWFDENGCHWEILNDSVSK